MKTKKIILIVALLTIFLIKDGWAQNSVVVIPLFGDDAASKWRGSWAVDNNYKTGDIIEFAGSSYIALVEHTASLANTPPSDIEWALVAASGANGVQGPQGDLGPKGDQSELRGQVLSFAFW